MARRAVTIVGRMLAISLLVAGALLIGRGIVLVMLAVTNRLPLVTKLVPVVALIALGGALAVAGWFIAGRFGPAASTASISRHEDR